MMDCFEPPGARASVVLVHGGGFVVGSRRMRPIRLLAARLVEAGLAVCAIDYRLGLRISGALDDTCAAFDHWARRAPDRDRISLVGLSAGGYLAYAAASRVPAHRVACIYGLLEIPWRDPLPDPTLPTLLLHGDADRLVRVDQAKRAAARRAERALPTELAIYPAAGHGFMRTPGETFDRAAHAVAEWCT